MNRKLTTWGIALLVLSILMPVLFFLLSLISWGLVEGLLGGIDWFLCMGASTLIFLGGLFLLVIGLRTD